MRKIAFRIFIWTSSFFGMLFWNKPVFFYSLMGFIADPSLKWLLPCAVAFLILDSGIRFMAESASKLNNLKSASKELANYGQLVEITETPDIGELIEREKSNRFYKLAHFFGLADETEIRIFLLNESKSISGGAFSIADGFGTSIILIDFDPSIMSQFQKFTLYHELEHSGRNATERSRPAVDRIRCWTFIVLMIINSKTLVDFLVVFLFLVYFELHQLLKYDSREISADQTALYQIGKETSIQAFTQFLDKIIMAWEEQAETANELGNWVFGETQRMRAKIIKGIIRTNPSFFLENYDGHNWPGIMAQWVTLNFVLSVVAAIFLFAHREAISASWMVISIFVTVCSVLVLMMTMGFNTQLLKYRTAVYRYLSNATH